MYQVLTQAGYGEPHETIEAALEAFRVNPRAIGFLDMSRVAPKAFDSSAIDAFAADDEAA